MINYRNTLNIVKGGLLGSDTTWQSYLQEDKDWKATFMGLTGPMILVSVILSAILTWMFSSFSMFGSQGGIVFTLMKLIGAVLGVFVASFVFSFLAGFFKGKNDFNKGFAALSLAARIWILSQRQSVCD